MKLIFHCRQDNDLYQVLTSIGRVFPRYDDFSEALESAPSGAALLSLADAYPRPELEVGDDHLHLAADRDLRLYLEYPASLPDFEMGAPRSIQWERVVVSSDFFSPALERDRILALHGCWYLPSTAVESHLVVARVAGYHTAVYGLPDETFPVLFELSGHQILIGASKLSQFVTRRYGPAGAWKDHTDP